VSDYGQIIVDECHHISAVSFERIVRKCSAYYRLGLSATIIRKDGQHPIVLMNLGEVRYSSVRGAVPLFEQKVFPRFTDFSTEHTAIHDIFHSLYQNEKRNKLIIQDILTAYREGRECLVLSERIVSTCRVLILCFWFFLFHGRERFTEKKKYGFTIMLMKRQQCC
jgi:hypothetical protein